MYLDPKEDFVLYFWNNKVYSLSWHSNHLCSCHEYQQQSCIFDKCASVSLTGFAEVVQLLREGEDQPAAAGQTRDEHTQCHARDSKPGEWLSNIVFVIWLVGRRVHYISVKLTRFYHSLSVT